MKKVLLTLFTALGIVLLACVIRALLLVPTPEGRAVTSDVGLTRAMVDRLSAAIQKATVFDGEDPDTAEELLAFRTLLETSFPGIHQELERQIISNYSLLFHWEGRDPSLVADLFVTHLDVAPVAQEEVELWTAPPFSGQILDGYVWGRGALDNKGPLLALLEAVEQRISEGYRPRRSLYIALGHDEETGGLQGALSISHFLQLSGVSLRSIFDEGGFLTEGLVPFTSRPVSLVGTAEKGYLTLELSVRSTAGHSAAPQGMSAIARLGEAIARIESNPLPPHLPPVLETLLEQLAPEMALVPRVAAANLWLFRPLVLRWLSWSTAFPLVRTTTATTVFRAGHRENVLPAEARALVNFRLLPGDSPERVIEHVHASANDSAIQVDVHSTRGVESYFPPAPESSHLGPSFEAVRRSVSETFPAAVTVPALNVGATDSRHFLPLTDQIFRFAPLRVSREDLARLHGIDERISLSNYQECIQFYYRLLENLDPAD